MSVELSKTEFIVRQIKRTHNKGFENYVITRIWHGINSTDVKMVTQQYVMRENGCALLDAFFPQFNIGIEVDEGHHKNISNVELDKLREKDVIRAIGCEIYRVDATHDIDQINKSCDEIVNIIKDKMNFIEFEPWNIEKEYSPERFIRKGFISIDDNAAFRRHIDALRCFGIYYIASFTGGENHPIEEDELIWFPKMHARKEWINVFDDKEETIYETNEDPEKNKDAINLWLAEKRHKRIVFAYTKDSLGMVLYRFKGVFKLDKESTKNEGRAVWRKISDIVRTTDKVLKGKLTES